MQDFISYYEIGLYLFALFLFIFVCYKIYSACRTPLSPTEVEAVAESRKRFAQAILLSFRNNLHTPDIEFKRSMPAQGGWIHTTFSLAEYPSWVAAQLKHKKHEWVAVGFADENSVKATWFNKGPNKTSVGLYLSPENIVAHCKDFDCKLVLILHNHPNPNPSRLNCTRASPEDHKSANAYYDALQPHNLSLIEFVCERGMHYKFYKRIDRNFIDDSVYIDQINRENNGKFFATLWLRLSLLFASTKSDVTPAVSRSKGVNRDVFSLDRPDIDQRF